MVDLSIVFCNPVYNILGGSHLVLTCPDHTLGPKNQALMVYTTEKNHLYRWVGEWRHCFTHISIFYSSWSQTYGGFVAAFIFFSMQSHDSTPVAASITWWLSKCREGDIFLSIWRDKLRQTKFFHFPRINWGKSSCCCFHFTTWTCRVPAHFPSRGPHGSDGIQLGTGLGSNGWATRKNDQQITGIQGNPSKWKEFKCSLVG